MTSQPVPPLPNTYLPSGQVWLHAGRGLELMEDVSRNHRIGEDIDQAVYDLVFDEELRATFAEHGVEELKLLVIIRDPQPEPDKPEFYRRGNWLRAYVYVYDSEERPTGQALRDLVRPQIRAALLTYRGLRGKRRT